MLGTEDNPVVGPSGESPAVGDGSPEAARIVGARWIEQHADAVWRFVMSRVRRADAAEDVVQETFLAALEAYSTFGGGSTERTWLLGIASHKVSDYFRKRGRSEHRDVGGADDGPACGCEVCRALFSEVGMWARTPGEWSAGESESEKAAAREALRGCVEALPEGQREAMWMRDVLGVPPEEVRKALGLTATNLWTRLHRARSAVRSCLEGKLAGPGGTRGEPGCVKGGRR